MQTSLALLLLSLSLASSFSPFSPPLSTTLKAGRTAGTVGVLSRPFPAGSSVPFVGRRAEPLFADGDGGEVDAGGAASSPPPSPSSPPSLSELGFDVEAPAPEPEGPLSSIPLLPIPSPLLLGSAVFLMIATVGSILTDDPSPNPLLHYGVPVASVPTAFFFFLAAIKKGQLETEEDDLKP